MESERNRVVYGEVVARVWQDADYKAELLANPKQTLLDAGMEIPPEIEVEILENTDTVKHFVLPQQADLTDAVRQGLLQSIEALLPLMPGVQIVIHQISDTVRYFLLPALPPGASALSEAELDQVAARGVFVFNIGVAVEVAAVEAVNMVSSVESVAEGVNAAVGADVALVVVAVVI